MTNVRHDEAYAETRSGQGRRGKSPRHALAPYQRRAVEQLALDIGETHRQIALEPHHRRAISRARGLRVLVAPTGAGKTLVLGRAIETLVPDPVVPLAGFKGSVWFWFTPYSGLVDQTRLALRAQCPNLRLRDPVRDREPSQTRDGDVFVSTWGAVASNKREARILRRTNERAWSLDGMIAALRDEGWFVGCVIDEAHVNFGVSARQASGFFEDVLQPDTAVLATATPRDEKLGAFLKAGGYNGTDLKIEIGRDEAVRAGLVKPGLVLGHLVLKDAQRDMIDEEETLVRAAVLQHERVKTRLADHSVSMTPLLLVQVPNEGGKTGAEKAKAMLKAAGLGEDAIRVHTATQPDPEFRSLAVDESLEALVFKMSAATGFDAPRAHGLVSLRPVITPEFGIQVIGRVMRVDPRIRANAKAMADPLLSRASVFVTGRRQPGLESAADHLAALRSSITPVVSQATLFDVGGTVEVKASANDEEVAASPPVLQEAEEMSHAPAAIEGQVSRLKTGMAEEPSGFLHAEPVDARNEVEPGLFGSGPIPGDHGGGRHALSRPGYRAYALRRELGVPSSLLREVPPDPDMLDDLARDAAAQFRIDDRVRSLLTSSFGIDVELRLRELLAGDAERSERFATSPSRAKVQTAAQTVLRFSDDVDPRLFRHYLVERFAETIKSPGGGEVPKEDLARAVDLLAVFQPSLIKDALAAALARHASVRHAAPLPEHVNDKEALFEAKRAAYGVFPSGLNGPERRFAELLDCMDGVRWWLRNPSHPSCDWSVRLQLPNGRGFHPDFVLGVEGRRVVDSICLTEVKDNGETGRLHSDENLVKIRARLHDYGAVLWVSEDKPEAARFIRLGLSDDRNRIVSRGTLSESDLRN